MAGAPKSKPGLLSRLRSKLAAGKRKRADRAHQAQRANEPRPGDQRRDSGVGNTGFGGM
jgi:hypothetical protein